MFRSLVWMFLFFSFNAFADNTAPQSAKLIDAHAAVLADIKVTNERVVQMEANWEKTKSEMGRDLIQQQIAADIRATTQQVGHFLGQVKAVNTPEALQLGEAVVNAENRFLEARLTPASSDLRQLFEQYEQAGADEQLLVLFNINDFYTYINWLQSERLDNLKLLNSWQVNTTALQQKLDHEITRYAEFMATYLRNNTRQKELLQTELKSLPANARSSLESKIAD